MRFVKIFRGYANDIEDEINELCHKRNLNMVSVASCMNQGILFVTVVFEKKEV